jgi:acyl-CoA synthetase (AMP-forming)/AMP-acid ligase II
MTWFSPEQALLPEIIALNSHWLRGKPALVVGDRTLTWSEFGATTASVANGLLSSGLARGDRVLLLMANSIEMAEAIFGTIRAGLTVVPLNVAVTDEAVLTMLADSGSRAVIASGEHVRRIESLRPNLPVEIGERCYAVDPPPGVAGTWQDFTALRDAAAADTPSIALDPADPCNIIYSSGTTGLPKGIVHSHGCRVAWGYEMAISLRYHSGARTLLTLGMYSNISWVAMLATVISGGTLVIRSRFAQDDCLKTIETERISHFAMVPVQYQRMLEYERFEEYDLSSLQAYMCCGSPLGAEMKRAIRQRLPGELIELYGLTEGLATILSPEDMDEKLASVGRPFPGQEICIVDDDGSMLGPGEAGEICGISRLMMSGYHGNARATEEATWTGPDGRRWLRTGDIGRLDSDGFLYLVDRKKDLIISGGQNVYPADIEAVVLTHAAVSEAAVIGVASRRWGETPVAIVALRPGAEFDADALTGWVNERLGKQQRIATALLVKSLPRNPNGKVLKRELRRTFADLELQESRE